MLSIELQGGIGNQLFQLAALESIATKNGKSMVRSTDISPRTGHSAADYFQTILLEWKKLPIHPAPTVSYLEPSFHYQEWNIPEQSAQLRGYFQNHRYISDSFEKSLWLPNMPILDGAFLHIRGGDYVNHSLHDVHPVHYYERAIQQFPVDTMFYIFTNDVAYAKTMPFLSTIRHTFVEEPDEIRVLSLMKNCTRGGICANSTFSWWGAYLNRKNRTLVLPNTWFNEPTIYIAGYFFPEAIICPC